ncbi:MFS transporter [Terrirubrum flagellatum]|uniref:MFS transporter n=1 Tax=Terrirubrum flagellatum TaxID=2895980 RepID=UPI003CC83715
MNYSPPHSPLAQTESTYAWMRLGAALLVGTIACVGNWSIVVALPTVQQEFGVARAGATLPYTFVMIGFGLGGVAMGRIADRFNTMLPILIGAVSLCLGYVAAGASQNLWQFTAAHALLGLGASAGFAPLMADVSHWFTRRRGLAVVIAACGSYLAGAIWPLIIQHFIDTQGWRWTHVALGLFAAATLAPLSLMFRPAAPHHTDAPSGAPAAMRGDLKLSPNALMALLVVAGFSCCVAMSMPQVHIVAYCGDLGYGVARGAEMLSLMLGLGIVSRVASGVVSDRIGGVRTLLIGSVMQGVALALYLFFNGLTSLYAISAIFGLFQGGIVPMYAVIIREYLPPREAGVRIGFVMMATIFGMAFGGYLSGLIFDLTSSYRMAFLNGLAWNMLNLALAAFLMLRPKMTASA